MVTKSKCNNDLHQGSFHINSGNITGHHRTLTSSLLLMILFTQSTAVLHRYLNDELKYFVCYNFSLRLHAQNSLSFPCSEKSLSIPGFPGLWPPCLSKNMYHSRVPERTAQRLVSCPWIWLSLTVDCTSSPSVVSGCWRPDSWDVGPVTPADPEWLPPLDTRLSKSIYYVTVHIHGVWGSFKPPRD